MCTVSNAHRRLLAGLALVGLIGWFASVSGCDSLAGPARVSASNAGTGSTRVFLPSVGVGEVRPVALQAFREHFRVDSEASGDNVWISSPADVTGRGESESPRVREVLSGASNRRCHLGELSLTPEGDGVSVRCKVRIQRLDTAERTAFAMERGDDRPSETPVDRTGGLSTSSRQEWVNVGRDRRLERAILDAIADRLRGAATASATAAP